MVSSWFGAMSVSPACPSCDAETSLTLKVALVVEVPRRIVRNYQQFSQTCLVGNTGGLSACWQHHWSIVQDTLVINPGRFG